MTGENTGEDTGENTVQRERGESRWQQLRRQHRFTGPLLFVLAMLTAFTAYATVGSIAALVDEVSHGRELDDVTTQLALLALVESVVSLGALAAVWLRRVRGVHVYVGAKAVVLVLGVGIAPEAVSMMVVVPLVLGGVLWAAASSAGWRADEFDRSAGKA